MLFTDSFFLFYFLPFSLALHRASQALTPAGLYPHASRWCLFLLTLIFYGILEPWWLLPFGFCVACDFILATWLHAEARPGWRRAIVAASVGQNLSLLVIFKYWPFLTGNLQRLDPRLADWLPQFSENASPLSLPPGISFYVFESLSFVIDVYRRKTAPPKRVLEFFSFIAMFPRFMAGPIVRYTSIQRQMENYRGMRWERGFHLFAKGLFLKVCFADQFQPFVGCAFENWEGLHSFGAWVGVLAFAFQLYFDFSGYSSMALGLGLCFGFEFPANFNRPYLATSVQDFWRRWHISLSSWLRDYLYIPLGGNRRGTLRTYGNLFLTMAIGGLWHGAQWSFVCWGIWHGVALGAERALGPERLGRLPVWLGRAYTFLVVLVGWVFFRSSGPRHALKILGVMFDPREAFKGFNFEIFLRYPLSLTLAVTGVAYGLFVETEEGESTTPWLAAAMLAISLLLLFSHPSNTPFLYYQF